MEAQEIRMRCLEAAQTATKAHGSVAPADAIVRVAREFEAYVVGAELMVPTSGETQMLVTNKNPIKAKKAAIE